MAAIRVDKEGKWYYEGREIVRQEVLEVLYQGLGRDEEGNYYVEWEGEREYISVEDTVFLVQWAELRREGGEEFFLIKLNDGTWERLDLSSFWIGRGNVPYCMVKGGRFPARFLRLPFYQVAQYAQYDDSQDQYYLLINGRRYPLEGRSEKV